MALNTGSFDDASSSAAGQQQQQQQQQGSLPEVARQNLESAYFLCRRFGWFSFWYQLSLTTVAAIVTLFSMAFSSQQSTQSALYFTLFGVITGCLSTFWSFGYVRLSRKLRLFLDDSAGSKKVRRSDVINSLEKGAIINVLGAGSSLIGLQSTIGILVARTLTTAAVNPYLGAGAQGMPSATPVAFDVFCVQATTNCLLSHFGSLVIALFLLRRIANRPSLV
ncbi:MAG: DUF3611 family protein [bacterium]